MATQRMNVLVYSGKGSTIESVRHCLFTLKRLLSPNYAVIPVNGEMIIKEPWPATCAAIVFPGGADQGYCRTLNGEGNRRIRQFVECGGAYIGFCAGGYYGSRSCEFEVGNKPLEVIGDRELSFFPGIARGSAFSGFVYNSEEGARATELEVNSISLPAASTPGVFKTYYNGGSVFVDAATYSDQGIEVLASYTEPLSVEPGQGQAAVVYCRVGDGSVLLTGPHPEFVFSDHPVDNWSLTRPRFAAVNLQPKLTIPGFSDVIKQLERDDKYRTDFLKACLTKLGLKVVNEHVVPPLSRIHLSSHSASAVSNIAASMIPLLDVSDKAEVLKDDNDMFLIIRSASTAMSGLLTSSHSDIEVRNKMESAGAQTSEHGDRITDYNSLVKQLQIHTEKYPDIDVTPFFSHKSFFDHLQRHQSRARLRQATFGVSIMYGEVVTSTNTLLEKNTKLLRLLPHGFTMTATTQVAGRGRGTNVWVSPPGSLIFSTVIRHPMLLMPTAPVIFVQYLAAMAVIDGIKNYHGGLYQDMPVKLKWPNDIFALDPAKYMQSGDRAENYTKIGGILVNSHYDSSEYIAVSGVGLNVSNKAPTISLNQLVDLLPLLSPPHKFNSTPAPPPFALEPLLASILASFEAIYARFIAVGFDTKLEQQYYSQWLHSDQIVTIETENDARARIKGITKDYGMLIADELAYDDKPTGRTFELMTDSNSFDFFKGLLKRK